MRRQARVAVLAAIFVGLGACDDQSLPGAAVEGVSANEGAGPHWEKVCSKEYFYHFSDSAGSAYCAEWQRTCVDERGAPSDSCV